MLDDIIGQIDAEAVLDESKSSFTTSVVSTKRNIFVHHGNSSVVTLRGLVVNGFKEEFKSFDKSGLDTGTCIFDASRPETKIYTIRC